VTRELTQSELRVAKLLALGKCCKEIAFDLGTAVGTVQKQRTTIFAKLEIDSPVKLAHYALWHYWICNNYSIGGNA
jgi:DNA-binding NarL/FixJ family response regulator